MRSHWLAALVAGMTITTLGCGETASSPSSGARMLNLMITDSPFSDAKAVLVTFSEVSVHRSDGDGWQRLPFADGGGSRTCDLKKLETAEDLLGVGGLVTVWMAQLLPPAPAPLYRMLFRRVTAPETMYNPLP